MTTTALAIRATAGAAIGVSNDLLANVDPRINLLIRALISFVSIRGSLKYFNDKLTGGKMENLKYIYVLVIGLAVATGINKKA